MTTPYFQDSHITLYNGDAREILPVLEGASMIFADPPFNAGKHYGSGSHNDGMAPTEYVGWLKEWLPMVGDAVLEGGTAWVMNDTRWIGQTQVILDDRTDLEFLNMIVWAYANPTPSKAFRKTWRPILLYSKGERPGTWDALAEPLRRDTLYLNLSRSQGPLCDDLWADIPKLVGGFMAPRELMRAQDGSFAHKVQMPEAIARRAILTATKPGDLIIDPFSKVARDLGRRIVAIEIEESYCELTARRLTEQMALVQG